MGIVRSNEKSGMQWVDMAVLVIAVVIAYGKIFGAGFISWDDYEYVLHNKDIAGVSGGHIADWFSHFYIGNYHPLTMFSYAVDYLIGSQHPFVYHLTNLLLHCCNAVILYFFINKLQPNRLVGLFVALLFALHPVQTESVSWIAERKTLLCGLFYFLALLQYVRYVQQPSLKSMILVVLSGAAAMLSKGVGVVIPLALVATDIWLRRYMMSKKVWIEKMPIFVLSIVFGIVAVKAQAAEKMLDLHPASSFLTTVLFAAQAYVTYIARLFIPVNLSVIYPYPQEVGLMQYLYLLLSLGIVALAIIAYRKKWLFLCGGIVFYTANIILVLQFVQFGECLTADRYLYIASIGVFFPVVYHLFNWLQHKAKQIFATVACSLVALLLLVSTFIRNDIWLSDLKFFSAILNTFPNSAVAQYSVGALYTRMGEYDIAESHLNAAVQIDPANYKAWYDKGALHLRQGRVVDALEALNKAISLKDYTKAYFSRAMLYEGTGKPELAVADADRVLADQPQNARAYYIKADCLEQQGNTTAALANYNEAISYEGNEALFYIRRGLLFAKTDRTSQALSDLNQAVTLNPNSGEALYYRGMVKYRAGQSPCADLQSALTHGYKQAGEAINKFCH